MKIALVKLVFARNYRCQAVVRWDTWTRRASKTSYVLSTPVVDVETDCLDQQTMCGLLPLTLGKIAIPRITLTPSALSIQQHGGFTCTQPVVKFSF